MSSALQDLFATHESRPVSRECQKQLGLLLHQCPPAETEQFLLAYHPEQLHLQLLRAQVATKLDSLAVLLDGIRSESKEVSKFFAKNPSLFSSKNSKILYDPDTLLPLLQTVSYGNRNHILSNLGRNMTDGNDGIADRLYESIVAIWGSKSARPLLCRTSENLIRKELEKGPPLSSAQILTIARRFPQLSTTLLDNVPLSCLSLKGARVLIRNNLPESLKHCVRFGSTHKLLSKTTTRRVLRNHSDVILASPSDWANILDAEFVKKVLKPETLELFVLKLVERELKDGLYVSVSYYPPGFIQYLPPKAVSSIMNKVDWAAIEDFWENNQSLLGFLDAVDRNRIASEMFAKTKDLDWLAFMTCDKSIPLIKEKLSSEANANTRSRLVDMLLSTVKINKDNNALEEVCDLVAVRYRNDRDVLSSFFQTLPDMASVGEKTWALVYALGVRLFEPSGSNYVYGLGGVFSAALKRNGKSGLKSYIDRFFKHSMLTNAAEDFANLEAELREECISLIFTSANVVSDNPERISCMKMLLPVISKWNASSVQPINTDNLNAFVLNNLDSPRAVDFVLNVHNGFPIGTVAKCFEETGNHVFLHFIVKRSSERLNVSRAAVVKMADNLIVHGCFKCIKLLKLLKKKGHLEVLKYLCDTSLASIRDPDQQSREHAIILLSLTTADNNEYLQETTKFLAEMEVGQELEAPFLSHPEPTDSIDQENILKQSLRKESVYKGIGKSFSFIDSPSAIVDLLLKFCINGDMMLFVRHSVTSVSYSLPYAGAQDLISRLVRKPVSVMKHALRIHQLISDVQTQRDFLVERVQTETHLTVRTCLFEYALSSLDNTANVDTFWDAVKEMMSRLTPKDKALVTLLHDKSVPSRFWEQYVKLLLEKTESLEEVEIDLVSSFLNKICSSIASMPIPSQLHENLIKAYFLSDRYFLNPRSHESVCNLFVAYLIQKADGQGSPESVIERKRLFLSETLDSAVSKIVSYDAALGRHPTKALLDRFVHLLCFTCQQQEDNGVDGDKNYLSIFIDSLLSFFARLDETLLFGLVVRLSLTAITCRRIKDTIESSGYLVGQFIDRVCAKNAGLAHHALPVFVENYFDGRKLDACFFQDLVLPSEPLSPETQLIRQVIVTKLLPRNWQTNKSFESFREKYLALIRNTPSEAIIFDDES